MRFDERAPTRESISSEEIAILVAERKRREAEADEADERERIKTIVIGLGGLAGLVVGVGGFLVLQNLLIGSAGFIASFVAVGVITASEGAKLLGRG